jgi:hypothetical protein
MHLVFAGVSHIWCNLFVVKIVRYADGDSFNHHGVKVKTRPSGSPVIVFWSPFTLYFFWSQLTLDLFSVDFFWGLL